MVPVRWEDELGGWLLTGYAEVAAALADPRVSRGRGPQEGDLLTRLLSRMMLFTDPPRPYAPPRLRNRRYAEGGSRRFGRGSLRWSTRSWRRSLGASGI